MKIRAKKDFALHEVSMNNYPSQWLKNPFGYIVYKRTYSRWLDQEQRRETWKETVDRVIQYTCSLAPVSDDERRLLFDYMFNLRLFPAGRTLWIGGTKASSLYPLANFNCSFVVIDSFEKYCEMFYALMLGVGVGFRILNKDVAKLPRIIPGKEIIHEDYVYNGLRIDDTVWTLQDQTIFISVGDSKEGWVEALRLFFDAFLHPEIKTIRLIYNNVRPAGFRLKTFGGRASGHLALVTMFNNITRVFNATNGTIRAIDALDIANSIAHAVVVGGVRRSSQIALFDDPDVATAKVNLYTDISKADKLYRAQSNNSWLIDGHPDYSWFLEALDNVLTNYEPGFLNWSEMKRRRPNANGVNPCSEIILDDRGVCNLTEVNLAAFMQGGKLRNDVEIAVRLAARLGLRQTMVHFDDLPSWDHVQQRDRLLGVSLTGIMDAYDSSIYSWRQFMDYITHLRCIAREEAYTYADELGLNKPLLVTTIKPSGTISQLAGVSNGIHRSFAPCYMRRMRVSKNDPMVRALIRAGYKPRPDGIFEDQFDAAKNQNELLEQASTWVFEFPIQTAAKIKASDESAVSQLRRYLDFQNCWTDHNTSVTIQMAPEEKEDVARFLYEHWNDGIVGVSFAIKDTNNYPLMPYKATDRYYFVTTIDFEQFDAMIDEEERRLNHDEFELDTSDCAGGFCPVR